MTPALLHKIDLSDYDELFSEMVSVYLFFRIITVVSLFSQL